MSSLRTRLLLPLLLSTVLATSGLCGCLWLPDWPIPDKVEPAPSSDNLPFAYCNPRPNRWEPILVGAATGSRTVECRIRGAESVLWTLSTEVDDEQPTLELDPTLLDQLAPELRTPLVLGRDVESVRLRRDMLPWSPRPYVAVLRASVQLPGEVTTKRWPLLVIPAADELESRLPSRLSNPSGDDQSEGAP